MHSTLHLVDTKCYVVMPNYAYISHKSNVNQCMHPGVGYGAIVSVKKVKKHTDAPALCLEGIMGQLS